MPNGAAHRTALEATHAAADEQSDMPNGPAFATTHGPTYNSAHK